jgi:hypothetical protein
MWQVMLAKCMTKLGQVAIARGQVGEANRSFMDALKMQEGHLVDQCNDM